MGRGRRVVYNPPLGLGVLGRGVCGAVEWGVGMGEDDEILGPAAAAHEFEPELLDPVPRAIPAEFFTSPYAQERSVLLKLLCAAGMATIGLALLPVMETWQAIFPPLRIVLWLGVAMVVGAVILKARSKTGQDRLEYVRSGIPIVARITNVHYGPQYDHTSSDAAYRYTVRFTYEDPEWQPSLESERSSQRRPATNDTADDLDDEERNDDLEDHERSRWLTAESESDPINRGLVPHVSTTYHEGDLATAVYFPGKMEKSIRLYGLLGFRPDVGVVRRIKVQDFGWGSALWAMAALAGFAFVVASNIYIWWRYWPSEAPDGWYWRPFLVGAAVFSGLQIVRFIVEYFWARHMRLNKTFDERLLTRKTVGEHVFFYVFGLLAAIVGGGLTMVCWFVAANALWDESPPDLRPVKSRMSRPRDTKVLFVPVMRACVIKYQFQDEDDKEPRKILAMPAERLAWTNQQQGVAEIGGGWHGWKWVRQVRPHQPFLPPVEQAE